MFVGFLSILFFLNDIARGVCYVCLFKQCRVELLVLCLLPGFPFFIFCNDSVKGVCKVLFKLFRVRFLGW